VSVTLLEKVRSFPLCRALLTLTLLSAACTESGSEGPRASGDAEAATGDDDAQDDDVTDDDSDQGADASDTAQDVDAGSSGPKPGGRDAASNAPTDSGSAGRKDAARESEAGSATRDDAASAPPSDASSDAAPAPQPGASLPEIQDPAAAGPFSVETVATAPGLSSHTLYVPGDLGKDGVKHPIIVWTNGNGGSTSFYEAFLRHVTSHGFFIVADKRSTSMRETEYAEQKKGIDWAVEQAGSGPYAGKIDPERIALMGHSMGSLSSFVNGPDPRVKTTVHWSGGLTGNPTGTDESYLAKLHAPAAFLCGGADGMAGPACANDFRDAPKELPVFYGVLAGVGHLGVFSDRNGGQYGRVGVAWLGWKLAGQESLKEYFVGSSCKACASPWTGMSRNLQ
jgi:dienelactone hydrolase